MFIVALVVGIVAVLFRPHTPAPTYTNAAMHFSIILPQGYAIDESYHYQLMGPGKDISGVKFTISPSVATSTNLAADTYMSVEEIPGALTCSAELFLDQATAQVITDGNRKYSVASSTGAGAGNRYEETVYALPDTNPCIAVRYFIHYGVIDNYPPGSVHEFDRTALLANFDTIRRTLSITK